MPALNHVIHNSYVLLGIPLSPYFFKNGSNIKSFTYKEYIDGYLINWDIYKVMLEFF